MYEKITKESLMDERKKRLKASATNFTFNWKEKRMKEKKITKERMKKKNLFQENKN